MGNFNRDDNRSGGGFNRGGFGGGRRDGGRPTMHQATCSECGASCEIPFRPSGGRPVFCSTCFEKQGSGSRPSRFGGDNRGERRERHDRPREDREMHDAVCAKCAKACQVPFMPKDGKPVFCESCFEKGGKGKGSEEVMEQIKLLSVKIDRIMKILAPNEPTEKAKKPEVKKEVAKEKELATKEVVKEKKSKSAPKKASAKKKK